MVSRRTFLSAGSVLAATGITVGAATGGGGSGTGPGEPALGTVEFSHPTSDPTRHR